MSILVENKEAAVELNTLAREEMKKKLLNDILIDLTICEIEKWDKSEYIRDLQDMINDIKV